jgi:hypothetical protein
MKGFLKVLGYILLGFVALWAFSQGALKAFGPSFDNGLQKQLSSAYSQMTPEEKAELKEEIRRKKSGLDTGDEDNNEEVRPPSHRAE